MKTFKKIIFIIVVFLFVAAISAQGFFLYQLTKRIERRDDQIKELQEEAEVRNKELEETRIKLNNLMEQEFAEADDIDKYISSKIEDSNLRGNCEQDELVAWDYSDFVYYFMVNKNSNYSNASWERAFDINVCECKVKWTDVFVRETQGNLFDLGGELGFKFGEAVFKSEINMDGYIDSGIARLPITIDLKSQTEADSFMDNFTTEITSKEINSSLVKSMDEGGNDSVLRTYKLTADGYKPMWLEIRKYSYVTNDLAYDVDIDLVYDKNEIRMNLD